jgi:hypothetical protein
MEQQRGTRMSYHLGRALKGSSGRPDVGPMIRRHVKDGERRPFELRSAQRFDGGKIARAGRRAREDEVP